MKSYNQIKQAVQNGKTQLDEEDMEHALWVMLIELIETLKSIDRKLPNARKPGR